MYCKNCGKFINDDESRCPYCKIDIEKKNNNIINVNKKINPIFDFYKKILDVKTLSKPNEFLFIFLIIISYNIILGLIGLKINIFNHINTILNIINIIPLFSLSIRRLHDANLSGFFSSLLAISLIVYMISYYEAKKNVRLLDLLISAVLLVISLFLFLKKSDPNSKYDPDNGYL